MHTDINQIRKDAEKVAVLYRRMAIYINWKHAAKSKGKPTKDLDSGIEECRQEIQSMVDCCLTDRP